MNSKKILVIEDDQDINRILCRYLEREGYQVIPAFSGTEGRLQLSVNTVDLIITDLMIPGVSGEELIHEIRETSNIPILVISAKTALEDKVKVLKMGADDYMTKPFEREEVLARVEAMLRRSGMLNTQDSQQSESGNLVIKELVLEPETRIVKIKNNPIALTLHEFEILQILMENPKRIFTKEQLYDAVFGFDAGGDPSAIAEHVKNIRAKLKAEGLSPVETVWGVGYKWQKNSVL